LNSSLREWKSANGFSELNDPAEQCQRFLEQTTQRERGDEEAMVMDEDYIRALSIWHAAGGWYWYRHRSLRHAPDKQTIDSRCDPIPAHATERRWAKLIQLKNQDAGD